MLVPATKGMTEVGVVRRLIDPGFMSEVLNRQEAWRRVVGRVVASGLPCKPRPYLVSLF